MEDVKINTPSCYSDERGDLWTIWNKNESVPNLPFNHDKVAKSKKGVLRGFHGDSKSWKLITCLYGEIFLAVVDYRKESNTFLETKTFILNDINKKTILIPPNFLNAHQVLSDDAVFFYKWSYEGDYPDVDEQFSVNWSDPIININWPIESPILSERDKNSKNIQSVK
jgi:dTDP-4-dehydrorhamnose 3,5-epimerase